MNDTEAILQQNKRYNRYALCITRTEDEMTQTCQLQVVAITLFICYTNAYKDAIDVLALLRNLHVVSDVRESGQSRFGWCRQNFEPRKSAPHLRHLFTSILRNTSVAEELSSNMTRRD
jgi:hypothetical protein